MQIKTQLVWVELLGNDSAGVWSILLSNKDLNKAK